MSRFASTAQLLAGGIAAAFTVASAAAQTASPPDFSSNLTSLANRLSIFGGRDSGGCHCTYESRSRRRDGPFSMAKSHLKLVAPTEVNRTVAPTRRPNAELGTREDLTPGGIVSEADRYFLSGRCHLRRPHPQGKACDLPVCTSVTKAMAAQSGQVSQRSISRLG
jgi:hypothetical protein